MSRYPYSFPTYTTCHACGDRHARDSRGEDLDREELALLEQLSEQPLDDESPLCLACVSDVRREYRERAEEERAADERELAQREDLAARYAATVARHPATVALCLRLPRLAAAMAVGALLTACDLAELDARADAAREAWIAAMDAEADLPPPHPWSSAWDPAQDALCGWRAA